VISNGFHVVVADMFILRCVGVGVVGTLDAVYIGMISAVRVTGTYSMIFVLFDLSVTDDFVDRCVGVGVVRLAAGFVDLRPTILVIIC